MRIRLTCTTGCQACPLACPLGMCPVVVQYHYHFITCVYVWQEHII